MDQLLLDKKWVVQITRPEPIQINLISYLSARLYIIVGHKDWPIVTLTQTKANVQRSGPRPRPLPRSHTHSPSMRTLALTTPFPHFPVGAHVSPFIK